MSEEKQPFHKVASLIIVMRCIGIQNDTERRLWEIMTVLELLNKSDLPAGAAAEVYAEIKNLPETLRQCVGPHKGTLRMVDAVEQSIIALRDRDEATV